MPRLRLHIFTVIAVIITASVASLSSAQIFDPLQPRTTRSRQKAADRQLYPIDVDSQWGFINTEGKVVIEPQFDTKGQFHNGMAVVTLKGAHGFVTHRGKFISLDRYHRLFPFFEDFARVSLRQLGTRPGPRQYKFTFVDKNGRNISPVMFDNAGDFSEGLARIYLALGANVTSRYIADSWGFINTRAEIVIRPQFQEVGDFSQGMARVNVQGQWGYIDTDGDITIEQQYDYADDFSEGLAVVQIGSNRGYINMKGKMVIKPQFEYAGPFRNGRATVARSLARRFEFITPRGRVAIDRKFEAAGTFSQGLARVYTQGKWGYIDVKGKMAVQAKFDDAHDFNGELALVSIASNWGYINVKGTFVWRSDRAESTSQAAAD